MCKISTQLFKKLIIWGNVLAFRSIKQSKNKPTKKMCSVLNFFFFFFFLSGFSFTNIHDSRDSRGRGHLDISRVITAESSPLHIAGSRTRTGNLWLPSALNEFKRLNFYSSGNQQKNPMVF